MSVVMSIFYPLFVFINAYRWYFIIAILLYVVLSMVFKFARQAITVVFAVLMLFFCLTHLPHLYNTIGTLMQDMSVASETAVNSYVDYVSENILSDNSLSPAEKLDQAIQFALSGKVENPDAKLPDADEKNAEETLDYVIESSKEAAGIEGSTDPDPEPNIIKNFVVAVKNCIKTIINELQNLVA